MPSAISEELTAHWQHVDAVGFSVNEDQQSNESDTSATFKV